MYNKLEVTNQKISTIQQTFNGLIAEFSRKARIFSAWGHMWREISDIDNLRKRVYNHLRLDKANQFFCAVETHSLKKVLNAQKPLDKSGNICYD